MACTPFRRPLDCPLTALLLAAALWKALLLIIAFLSPGPGYDTSTTLLFDFDPDASPASRLAARLTRWDAVYFVTAADRGHLYEQEWAFSWALANIMAALATCFPSSDMPHVWAGIVLANLSHALSVLALYALLALALARSERKTAFVAALLHVFSPAGLFLSAPYGEALFSLLSFLGMLLYVKACRLVRADSVIEPAVAHFTYMLSSGLCFGLATLIRSNGLLSGIVFALDLIAALPLLVNASSRLRGLQVAFSAICAGILLGTGLVIPQVVAYGEYCLETETRPWCARLPPSIYAFVQDHYWNVGFLRYWTVSNIPLFLLAAPTTWLLISSALKTLRNSNATVAESTKQDQPTLTTGHILQRFALPQLALALLALFNFHVQIINRVSSGYPLWYLAVAAALTKSTCLSGLTVASPKASERIARLMAVYAVVQGALYSSFLPPA